MTQCLSCWGSFDFASPFVNEWADSAQGDSFAGCCIHCSFASLSFTVFGPRMPTTGERFERAVSIMARLRGPGWVPWDREQSFDSIKPYPLEETYEILEAIDNRDWDELPGELGDLLLQVLFYAQMAK